MNKSSDGDLRPSLEEYAASGELQSLNPAGLGTIIEADKAEQLLFELQPPAATIPLWSGRLNSVVSVRFESEQWMRVFAYLPENGNRGQIWTGNRDYRANAWCIPAVYTVIKIEIFYRNDGEWKPAGFRLRHPQGAEPDPSVRVYGYPPSNPSARDVTVYISPTTSSC